MSGDAKGANGVFSMTNGTLSYTGSNGPLFYITNSSGIISLENVNINVTSGILIKASGNERWGKTGSNGGNVKFTLDSQIVKGDIIADEISSVELVLKNISSLTGAINSSNKAKSISLTLDNSSVWIVTSDSFISVLEIDNISGDTINNILGNGYTVYYDSKSSPKLNGKTYLLKGGGQLKPIG